MTCSQCREQLIAWLDGQLDAPQSGAMDLHVQACPDCARETASFRGLRDRMFSDAAGVAGRPVDSAAIMDRILKVRSNQARRTHMRKRTIRVFAGLAVAAALALAFLANWPGNHRSAVTAAEVMRQGIAAMGHLKSVYLKLNVRAAQGSLGNINLQDDLGVTELWKEFGSTPKWRAETLERAVVCDGETTTQFIKRNKQAHQVKGRRGFIVDMLNSLMDVDQTLDTELQLAKARGWAMDLSQQQAADGRTKLLVTVQGQQRPLTPEELQNAAITPGWGFGSSLEASGNRRVYQFDAETKRLEDVKVYANSSAGETLVLEVAEIQYDLVIDPGTFALTLPLDTSWYKGIEVLPNNAEYAAMSPEQTATAFFQACAREDWAEVAKFDDYSPSDLFKQYYGGLEIISIGKAFQFREYAGGNGCFVPYEIKLKNGEIKKWNLALRTDNEAKRYQIDGGI